MVQHPTDLETARRVLAGDRAAFDAFFESGFSRLYRFVLLRADRDVDVAQDICQQVFERGLRRLSGYRGEASLFTWLCQIARNELADHWRRTSRDRRRYLSFDQDDSIRQALESLAVDASESPEAAGEQAELSLLIQSVLDHLPAHYGDALDLKYVKGYEASEIAARLDVSADAAHSLLARARRAFRSEFTALAQELK